MKYLLVVFVLVNLCIFASALDRTKLLHKHSRKHARGSDTQANAGSSNAASTVASAAGAASQVAAATTKVAESAKQAVTTAVTDKAAATDKASTQTTSQSQTQTQAAAATKAASAATTTTKQTATSTTSTQTTAAAQDKAKILDTKAKTFDGRAIEHVTKEPAPAGMVRPVLVPPPDAIPSTFTVRPHIEGQPEAHATPLPASAATHMVPVEDASSSPSSSSQTTPLPQFTQAQDGSSSKNSKWWGHRGGSVTAEEVSSFDADEKEDNFPPKYPPCSENECAIQVPTPPCCSATPPPPYTHGYWWHHNKGGKQHVHVHMHTAAESPEQIYEENAQAAKEDAEVHAAGSDSESSPPQVVESGDESATEAGGAEEDEQGTTDEESADDGESQAGEDDADEGDTVEGQRDGINDSTGEFVPSSTGSGETMDDSVTVTVSLVNTLIAEALAKSHEQIVAELTSRLDAVQATHATNEEQLTAQVQSFKTELESLKTTVEGFVNKQGIPGPRGPKGDKGDPATIILHDHHHHHHHHHDDDDDEDADEDDDDDDADDDDQPANPFTSTGASTIDLLKSMEAASEDLTDKMDQADVLDAAAGDDNDDDSE